MTHAVNGSANTHSHQSYQGQHIQQNTTSGTPNSGSIQARTRGRFSWVRRLVMGPNRSAGNQSLPAIGSSHHESHGQNTSNDNQRNGFGGSSNFNRNSEKDGENELSSTERNSNGNRAEQRRRNKNSTIYSNESNEFEDQGTTNSLNDNISTIPLKSLSSISTKSNNSILNENSNINDDLSIGGSTTETSIAPSSIGGGNIAIYNNHNQFLNPNFQNGAAIPQYQQLINQDRDSESIITLASSSRRVKRRSLDTNCSTTGIAPASIMERLNVNSPSMNATTNNSSTNLTFSDD